MTLEASTDPYAPVTAVDGDASGGLGSGQVLVRTLAGSANANGFVDGIGTNARFRCLIGLDLDADGNLFVVDGETNSIRRVEPSGLVSTVAGVRGLGSGHVNGAGNIATFMYPTDVAVVPAGTFGNYNAVPAGTSVTYLLVADLDNYRIRLIRSPNSGWSATMPWEPRNPAFYEVATIAGDGTSGHTNGVGTTAQFAAPGCVAVGPGGVAYVLERAGGNRVRQLTWTGGNPMLAANWQVSPLAGSTSGTAGYVDAPGTSAQFSDPRGLTVGPDGTVYVADTYNHCIRAITPDGAVTTLAGTNSSGYTDAAGTAARFYCPWDVAAGPDGYLYVADRYNYAVRRVSPTGVTATVARSGSSTPTDGTGATAGFYDDLGLTVGRNGTIYLAEAEAIRILQRIISVGDASATQ